MSLLIPKSKCPFIKYKERKINDNHICIAIFIKDKEYSLPLFLHFLECQDYPKSKIHLYIRINDCSDNSVKITEEWLRRNISKYGSVKYNSLSISKKLSQYKDQEWNPFRFRVMTKIRSESIQFAQQIGCHYFTCDVDCFLTNPRTISNLLKSGKDCIAPMLVIKDPDKPIYSNYFYHVNEQGFFEDSKEYYDIYYRENIGVFEVGLIHITYFIKNSVLKEISYSGNPQLYEFIRFANNNRKKGIKMYIDNQEEYGYILMGKQSLPHYNNLLYKVLINKDMRSS